jgi:toxin ParE1/3/4
VSDKAVVLRALARQDVERAVDWYASEAGGDIALGFIDAIEAAYRAITRNPGIGSPRYAHELNLPGLRTHKLRRYPYLIFYVERDGDIGIWRVLHAQRDIPVTMQEGVI